MKISLFGYGKMGKAIERIAESRGHEVVQRIGSQNAGESPDPNADAVIEFSLPSSAVDNINACIDSGVPVVVGTTGWLEHLDTVTQKTMAKQGSLLHASNFSVGVNIFFAINQQLAAMMNDRPEYKANVEETHHIHKVDAPSGTAITIAEGIMENVDRYKAWSMEAKDGELNVVSHRENEVPGTHKVTYASSIDDITIEHKAHNREGFALGAVLAAEWIQGRTGVFTMQDVLNF